MIERYTLNRTTIMSRKKKCENVETVNWSELWSKFSDQLIEECLPNHDMLDENITCYHGIKDENTFYYVEVDADYVSSFFCKLLYERLKRDEDYLVSLKAKIIEQRRENAKAELENQIEDLARTRYNALSPDDETTLDEIRNQIRQSLGL